MPAFPGFPSEGLQFLRDLKLNNRREWFEANRALFEEKVKQPMAALVTALGEAMAEFAPEMLADPKKSVYRLHRDVRFSKDKSPYKTQVAASFWPRGLERHSCAGMYFHVSGDEVLVGGGVYMPRPQDLLAIRQRIAAGPDGLRAILRQSAFRKQFRELIGEKLKRTPKGFAAGHPAADLLVYKQFLVLNPLPPDIALTKQLQRELIKNFRAMTPFLRWLNEPLQG